MSGKGLGEVAILKVQGRDDLPRVVGDVTGKEIGHRNRSRSSGIGKDAGDAGCELKLLNKQVLGINDAIGVDVEEFLDDDIGNAVGQAVDLEGNQAIVRVADHTRGIGKGDDGAGGTDAGWTSE